MGRAVRQSDGTLCWLSQLPPVPGSTIGLKVTMRTGKRTHLTEPLVVVSPPHVCNAQTVIAAVRAGAIGLLDLGMSASNSTRQENIVRLSHAAQAGKKWGIYWDVLEQPQRFPHCLKHLNATRWPVLLLGGIDVGHQPIADVLTEARRLADQVLIEVCSPADALAAQAVGFDGLVLKGNESGGRVSVHSSFIFLQHVAGSLTVPYWVAGGVHPSTVSAAVLAGATGVVLREHLWLTRESPLGKRDARALSRCDGSETLQIGDASRSYRILAHHNRPAMNELRRKWASGQDWFSEFVRLQLSTHNEVGDGLAPELIPAGQDIAFSGSLANANVTVGHVIGRFRAALDEAVPMARQQRALAPMGPLCQELGTRYPIVQGPMTRVSDGVEFCASVARAGALPFLALGMMDAEQIERLMRATRQHRGDAPWGAGILAFLPPAYLREQMRVVRELRPPFALLAGGRPDQVRDLEQLGIKTYVHAPSPGVLKEMIKQGVRRIVLEGRECGGHVGPRSSFTLWASASDVLMAADIKDPETCQVLFAGGIHDALSAAMVSVIAAPLVHRGMKIGVVIGTAYIGTNEAVETGAITPRYQQQALQCRETVLLETGLGHASRCVRTAFAEEFEARRHQLVRDGKSPDEIRMDLEMLCLGRLRLASKGLARQVGVGNGPTSLVNVSDQQQSELGMFMIGDAATLMRQPQSMTELHRAVTEASCDLVDQSTDSASCVRVRRDEVTGAATTNSEPLAVIGMACRFPQSNSAAQYWRNILAKFNAVREIPPDRWNGDLFFTADRFDRDKCYSKWGAFLDEVIFDPLDYGIPPASMSSIEPVQLIALDVAGAALRDAGYFDRPFCRDRAAVIFAVSGPHNLGMAYGFRTMLRQHIAASESLENNIKEQVIRELDQSLPTWTEDSLPGFLNNMVAGRISNHFDLRGPNFVVDAACAASLAALHIAVEQLRSRTCDVALVGAADATNSPVEFMSFAKVFALSPRGKPCPFDDSADGIVLGEGVGAVVLKRLSDAERDGDDIYAVIRGVGAASDGRNRSLTAPDRDGQIETLRRAYADAGIEPGSVGLVEAHGTGTALGDRIEAEALTAMMSAGRAATHRCAVGSVKSMIGHTKTAAGLASLIKVCLALRHKVLPPTRNVTVPNHHIDFIHGPLYVNTEPRPWVHDSGESPRRAAVSAFGFGGTNFHAVLEEYNSDSVLARPIAPSPVAADLFLWNAADRTELVTTIGKFQRQLAEWCGADIEALAVSHFREWDRVRTSPTHAKCRLAAVAENANDLQMKLDVFLKGLASDKLPGRSAGVYYGESPPVNPSDVCFLFPGQGSQHLNMLRDLALHYTAGLSLFAEADRWLSTSLPKPLSQYIYPIPVFDDSSLSAQRDALNETFVAQPALGATCLFALDLLRQFGLSPGIVAGHSYGEIVALHAAGCLTRRQMVEVSGIRGDIVHRTTRSSRGGMAVVMADEETVARHLQQWAAPLSIANVNAPNQVVVAGPLNDVVSTIEKFTECGLRTRRLSVTAAFHTTELRPAAAEFATRIAELDLKPPAIPVYSNVTAMPFPADSVEIRDLMVRQLTERVRFTEQIRNIHAAGARVFVEVGPRTTLTSFARNILADEMFDTLALDIEGRHGVTQLAHLLAHGFALGMPVQCAKWFAGRPGGPDSIPAAIELSRSQQTPKKSQWILSANGARPHTSRTPTSRDVPYRPAAESIARDQMQPAQQNVDSERRSVEAQSIPAADRRNKVDGSNEDLIMSMNPDKQSPPPDGPGHGQMSVGESTLVQPPLSTGLTERTNADSGTPTDPFQDNIARWLELQQSQQRTHEQFLHLQERYLDYLQDGVGGRSGRQTPHVERTAKTPAAETPELLMPLRVPPAPTLPPIEPNDGSVTSDLAEVDGSTPNRSIIAVPERAVAPTKSESSEILSVEEFRRILIDLISDRTGYTEDALDENLLMEADLGIDSIKRIEIFSSLTDYCSFMMRQDRSDEELLMTFTSLKTIQDIVDAFAEERARHVEGAGQKLRETAADTRRLDTTPAERLAVELKRSATEAEELPVDPIMRFVVCAAEAPLDSASSAGWRWPRNQTMLVVGELSKDDMVWRWAAGEEGPKMCYLSPGDKARRVAPNHFTADLASAESISELHRLLYDDEIQIGGLLNLLPLTMPYAAPDMSQRHTVLDLLACLYHLLWEFESELRAHINDGGGKLINVTSLGGKFGIGGGASLPLAQAGTIGLLKSVGCEWPGTMVKNIDVEPNPEPSWLMNALMQELVSGDTSIEVGLTKSGRWRPELRPTSLCPAAAEMPILERDAVILATGGARGITAEVVKRMAETYHCRFVLLGRTKITDDDRAANVTVSADSVARSASSKKSGQTKENRPRPSDEVVTNICQIEQHAASVEYRTVDVRDVERFAETIDAIYAEYGRIDGVIHGAGVTDDRLISSKTMQSVADVVRTKVDGARVLAEKLHADTLQFLVFFSSVSARFGNSGQSDYCAANECLNKLADDLNSRWPARVVAINWGPWDRGLVTPELASIWAAMRIQVIPSEAGANALISELSWPKDEFAEVVIGCSIEQISQRRLGMTP